MGRNVRPSPYGIALAALRYAQSDKGNALTRGEAEETLELISKHGLPKGTTADDVLETLRDWNYLYIDGNLILVRETVNDAKPAAARSR